MLHKLTLIFFLACVGFVSGLVHSKDMPDPGVLHVNDMVQQIMQNYASISIAAKEIEKSGNEFAKIESQLGWVLSAQTGVSHDVSFIDSPSDRFEAGVGVGRQYKSGTRFDVQGQYTYEDSSTSFSPFAANPSERTRLDLQWRIPFGRGDGNPAYSQGLVTAESGLQSQTASQIQQIDSLVQQAINLYFDAAVTHMRIEDANKSIDRARKLKAFINRNRQLGLAEQKDLLIVQAQLDGLLAQRDNLLVAWSRQKSEINRLTGAPLNRDFILSSQYREIQELSDQNRITQLVQSRDPQIAFYESQLNLADANIALAKDARQEQLDVVLSIGARTSSGDTQSGSVSDEEWAGAARLEYQYDLDKRGFDASLYQSMLQKDIAREQLDKARHDLEYTVHGLIEQIRFSQLSVKSNRQRLQVEKKKMDDVLKRYRDGRADTNEVIDFENALNASRLAYENQRLELARTYSNLNLLLGRVWNEQNVTNKVAP